MFASEKAENLTSDFGVKMKKLNLKCKKYIEENYEKNIASGREVLDYLDHSTAKYKGETIYSLYIPKIFTEEAKAVIQSAAETIYNILIKVMKEYIRNEAYRKLFDLDKDLEKMILNVPEYDNLLPIARVDIFLNEEDYSYKFCEFNADGCSSMNEDRELNIAFQKSAVYEELTKEYELHSFELFDTWAEEVENIYKTDAKYVPNAHVAVVDFLEKGCSMEEFEEFRKAFERKGFTAEVCEIRELTYDGKRLYSKTGKPIDVIYRRAVTSDILAKKNEVTDFLKAVEEKNVCLIGNFCTQIIHDKIIFQVLHMPETYALLEENEIEFIKAHIPYTVRLTTEAVAEYKVLETKDSWIIKPEDSYGAKGIFDGKKYSSKEWKDILEQHKNKDYLLQEYVTPYKSYNIDCKKEQPEFKQYSNLTGLYLYNGKFAGVYSRQSVKEIISTDYDENDIGSLWMKKR